MRKPLNQLRVQSASKLVRVSKHAHIFAHVRDAFGDTPPDPGALRHIFRIHLSWIHDHVRATWTIERLAQIWTQGGDNAAIFAALDENCHHGLRVGKDIPFLS